MYLLFGCRYDANWLHFNIELIRGGKLSKWVSSIGIELQNLQIQHVPCQD